MGVKKPKPQATEWRIVLQPPGKALLSHDLGLRHMSVAGDAPAVRCLQRLWFGGRAAIGGSGGLIGGDAGNASADLVASIR